jgi:hypothetical protein
MRHPDEGTLRRLCDDPLAIPVAQRTHIESCTRCANRLEHVREEVRQTATLFAAPVPTVNMTRALVQTKRRLVAEPMQREEPSRAGSRLLGRLTAPLSGIATAAALTGALVLTPAGSYAQSLLTIFQPDEVVAVPVTSSDIANLPDLRDYGTLSTPHDLQPSQDASAQQASADSGIHVMVPASVPSGTPSSVVYNVLGPTNSTFTFSAAKAQAAALKAGKTAPAMPANLDGSTLTLHTGALVVAMYGAHLGTGGIGFHQARASKSVTDHKVARPAAVKRARRSQAASDSEDLPALVIGQMTAPTVSSTGVTVDELENYVLSLPGISPQLAASVRSLGSLSSTLPIPIPVDLAHADKVTIQGAQGLAVGDSTGVGSAVVWEKAGIIYGVAGSMTEQQALDVANSLH